ncbi:hypothetical protein [Bordetella tumulicola]|uniref:hypothetical protein n=1 Tax=Bordetella tumulicola TaxID=1649133 RepID=UPI0039EE8877
MRETLDCAVLMTPGHTVWAQDWVDSHHGQFGRLRLHVQDLASLAPGVPDAQQLSCAQLALRRFDGCVLPVAPSSLSWARTLLANAETGPRIPLVAVVFDITAPAILDLLSLGVADFVRAPVCLDELRARLVRLHREARPRVPLRGRDVPPVVPLSGAPYAGAPGGVPMSVNEPLFPYRQLGASHPFASDAKCDPAVTTSGIMSLHRQSDESFRQAKARVVDGFEQAYLRRALAHHAGNVAQAARASSKHRRAFWALMRKHRIDAAHYRNHTSLPEPPA